MKVELITKTELDKKYKELSLQIYRLNKEVGKLKDDNFKYAKLNDDLLTIITKLQYKEVAE